MVSESAETTARIQEIAERVKFIHGFLYPQQGPLLYRLARFEAPVPTIVELGSWRGLSTAWLGLGAADRGDGHVFAVDHWKGSPESKVHQSILANYAEDHLFHEFLANMDQLGLMDRITPLRADTVEASRRWPLTQEIGLLFIDASHTYEAVRRDFEFWSPLVAPGGLIAFHDVSDWDGPTRVVAELPRWIKKVDQVQSLWVGQKQPGTP